MNQLFSGTNHIIKIGLLTLLIFSCASLKADEPKTYTEQEVNRLIERLDQAELKISEVQNELEILKKDQTENDQTEEVIPVSHQEPQLIDGTFKQSHATYPASAATYPASAYEDTTPSEYDAIKSSMDEKWAEQESFNEEIEKSLKHFVIPGTSLSTMKISGRIHVDFWGFPGDSPGVNVFETGDPDEDPQNHLGFRRARLGASGDVWENMGYKIEMEFAGGDDSQFRDLYFSFKELPFFQTLRIGNQKRPYGLDHLNSSRYNVFLERPFIIEAFNQDSRRIGIQSWGYSEDLDYNWRYGVFNQRLIQDEGDYISDHLQGQIAARFANTLWYDHCDGRNYGHWAVSGTAANPDGNTLADNGNIGPDVDEARFRTRPEARSSSRWLDTGVIAGADWYELLGLESVVNFGPVQLVGEYQYMWLQREADYGSDLRLHGGYAYISYFLTGEYMPWDRKTGTLARIIPNKNFFLFDRGCGRIEKGWGAWQVATRYSYANLTDENIYGGVGHSITFGLNWYWNPNAGLQFNYIYGDISDRMVTGDDGNVYTGGDYHILGVRCRIDF